MFDSSAKPKRQSIIGHVFIEKERRWNKEPFQATKFNFNSILFISPVPDRQSIKPEHVTPSVLTALVECKITVQTLSQVGTSSNMAYAPCRN